MRKKMLKRWGAMLLALALVLGLDAPALAFTELLTESNSLPMMVDGELPEANGDGVVIAIIDSGFLTEHEAFKDHGLTKSPALSQEDVERFVSEGGTPGKYISPRIPFAYDYCDDSPDVHTKDEHGTHVAAIAGGYAENEDGSVRFRGVAPGAQLILLKVFPDEGGSADNEDVLKAIQDAADLGADIISLSLGSDSGFVSFDDMEGEYLETFRRLREEGVLLCCAAGNSSAIPALKTEGVPLPTGSYTDYGTMSSPSVYRGALAVAAADADTQMAHGFIGLQDKKLAYVDSQPGEGHTAPKLETLHGKTLPIVLVPGVGTPEDFASVDVRGKIALVSRGEITFGDKATNAAKAGAKACFVYNTEEGVIRASVDTLTIPCATVTQEDGALLCAAAENGESVTISKDAYLIENDGVTVMMEASSWGSTPDLRVGPHVTAPGGNILSAIPAGEHEYEQFSGTSMATPNCTGALAVCLQTLRERGIEDKKQRADLAEVLLESSARLLTDEEGTPLSPRRQGTGLVDMTAALKTELVVTTPLLSPGDSTNGIFTIPIHVRNLGSEAKTVEFSTTVLTEDFAGDETGTWSLMLPLDITEEVRVTGLEPITVPAGGESMQTAVIKVPDSLRATLDEAYPNGFFVEGFITAKTDKDEGHGAFVGYCGDWKKAPVLEKTDHRDILEAPSEAELPQTELGGKLIYRGSKGRDESLRTILGVGEAEVSYLEDRAAFGGADSDAVYRNGYMVETDLYLIRNARRLVIIVSDGNKPLMVDDMSWVTKTTMDPLTMELSPSITFYLDGRDSFGEPLANDTRLTVSVYGWIEDDEDMERLYASYGCDPERPDSYRWLMNGYDNKLQWRFDLTLDREAPKAEAKLSDEGLTVTIRENQFLDWATIWGDGEEALAEDVWGDEQKGESHELFVPAEKLKDVDTLRLAAADYAGNITGFMIRLDELDGESHSLDTCPVSLLKDVSPDAWYHEAVDNALLWGYMESIELGTFDPTGAATRAQVMSALYAMADGEVMDEESEIFEDVPMTMDGREAILWAVENGIAQGVGEKTFLPLAPVSRQQLAVFLYRLAEHLEADTTARAELTAEDSESISSWAEEAMAWAVGEGLFSVDADGKLDPRGNVTRAQLAEVILRLTEETEEAA